MFKARQKCMIGDGSSSKLNTKSQSKCMSVHFILNHFQVNFHSETIPTSLH
uniref:Uncharacterized protein n=2 Tax=Anguilla anguilla TaxID=7936 RepID=A0A0E9TL14_ANGAN